VALNDETPADIGPPAESDVRSQSGARNYLVAAVTALQMFAVLGDAVDPSRKEIGMMLDFKKPGDGGGATGWTAPTIDRKVSIITEVAKSDVRSGTVELTQQQQREKRKSRRREFKAVYLTAAIVGAFVILWSPHILGRILASVGYINPLVVNYIGLAAGAIGSSNFAFNWAVYAAVSKSYRRAYRQTLIRIGCCCCKNVTLQADNSLIV